ncbi:hypothetical protein FIBSPDRAFT_29992 [Athelia psychrophila]|uniref:Ubiquitin-like domain-containing protein n=1 Tax=Athelia psychrophila TaxID=1759441 RepID=A0A166G196_9AGAM|nr:hypothetical protein FIBSPDRAFT_29992 [Fibularhizoctonia sp. CBS 109695]
MPTASTIHITARTFTGKLFPIDVEPTHTVDELKALIVAAGKGKSVKVPGLEYKGHELRDTRRVDHYGLVANDVLYIVPPSKVPKIALELEKEDGSVFDITVSSGITVAQLKEEIKIEEKIPVRQLKLVNSQEDEDGDEVVTLLEMQDDKAIAEYSLEGQKVLVDDSVWEAVSAPSAIGILVSIDDRIEDAERNRIGVAVRLDQTLGSFKELLLNKHAFTCTEHSLILIGRELKDDEQTLGDLGFIEGCTIHLRRCSSPWRHKETKTTNLRSRRPPASQRSGNCCARWMRTCATMMSTRSLWKGCTRYGSRAHYGTSTYIQGQRSFSVGTIPCMYTRIILNTLLLQRTAA